LELNNRVIEIKKELLIMNRLFSSALYTLLLVANVSPSWAQDIVALNNDSIKTNQVTPVNLVKIAYQGFLRDQGISSGGKLIADVKSDKVTAEILVQGAIDKGRLSPQTLNDEAYLNIVQSELDSLNRG
jgi:hypothetical protein